MLRLVYNADTDKKRKFGHRVLGTLGTKKHHLPVHTLGKNQKLVLVAGRSVPKNF